MSSASGPTVLVVEDEMLQRMMALDIVRRIGLPATFAASAEEAMLTLERSPEIGIVFTDIDLGKGMDGIALAAAVKRRWPEKAFIFTSGHVSVGDAALPQRARFLAKPYRQDDLSEALLAFAGQEASVGH
ncbi:response regulator [Acetobacteraceae bacterium H6797]|nr:response regulator [Acetobacteraceae bacterium H6797]